jgi:hypothetical protein
MPNLPDDHARGNQTVVAWLLDYRPNAETMLSGTIAASPRATRLAIATWKTIRVWPLSQLS